MTRGVIPADERVYAVGDVHGRLDLFTKMREMIAADLAGWTGEARVVFLGDYIDRGPDSKGVIDAILHMPFKTSDGKDIEQVFLGGNHEAMFVDYLDGVGDDFLYNGGTQTLNSYGFVKVDPLRTIKGRMGPKHMRFLKGLKTHIIIGGYLFVHAGIYPGVPLHEQDPITMKWIRRRFLESDVEHPWIVVHGHSIAREPDVRENRIGIDTGAYRSGRLTAVVLDGAYRRFLQT